MDPVRVGVVGLRHGMACLLEVVRNPQFELVGLCSATDESYRHLCGEAFAGPLDSVTFTASREELILACRKHCRFEQIPFHTDLDALLALPDLEAVILAPPIRLNAAFAQRALAAGKHVLAAKPFARTLGEGRALDESVRAASTTFMLGFEFRHSPLAERIKASLEAGAIGDLRMMWWNMFRMPFRASYRDIAVSGGAFLAEVCHWFDLFHHFNDRSPFARVAAFGGIDVQRGSQNFADNAVTIIEYQNGVRASINFTYFTDQAQNNLFGLVGTNGKLTADTDAAGRFTILNGTDRARTQVVVDPDHAHQGHLGFDVMHRHFAEVIRSGERINETEAEAGFESQLVSLAAQCALDARSVVVRGDILSSATP